MSTLYDDPGSFEAGRRRRYWPAHMSYDRWLAMTPAEHQVPGHRIQEYIGPSGSGWEGFGTILRMLQSSMLPPGEVFQSVLDVGCSTGVWMVHTTAAGIDTWGVDISRWAVEHHLPTVGDDRIAAMAFGMSPLPDHFPPSYDLVTAFDLLEHIFESDVDAVLEGIIAATSRHVALCVCTARDEGEIWVADKGPYEGPEHLDDGGRPLEWVPKLGARSVPPERLWQAVSGHVTIQTHDWWVQRIEAAGLRIRWDAMHRFEQARRVERTFCYDLGAGHFTPKGAQTIVPFPGGTVDQVASWGPRFVILAEKAEPQAYRVDEGHGAPTDTSTRKKKRRKGGKR